MGLKSIVFFSVMVCLSAAPSRAQDGAPPVLDPADVFTDAVEVVETLPILNADNAARMLWYFDPAAGEWRGFAYPEEIEDMERPYVVRRRDGTFIVGDFEDMLAGNWWYQGLVKPQVSWIFDPVSAEFIHPEAACGIIKDLLGEGQWIVYQNPEDDMYYLCFTETGNFSDVLPETVQQKLCFSGNIFWKLPAIAPDRNWLIFNECDTFAIYASDLTTGQTNYLGALDDKNLVIFRIDQWLDETTLTIRTNTFGPDFRNFVYLADLAQPNSLELIANQYSREPQFYDNPPRYIWDGNETLSHESSQRGWQEIYEYNLQTRERRVLVHESCSDILHSPGMFSFCSPSIAIPNGSKFLAVLSAPHMGMFELVTIFDMDTGNLVYETAASNPSGFVWQDDTTFSYRSNDRFGHSDTTHMIAITNHGLIEITPERPIIYFSSPGTRSPDGNLWLGIDYPNSFSLYELDSEQVIPVLLEFDRELYNFRARWQSDGTLLVEATDISGYMYYGAWIVRVQ